MVRHVGRSGKHRTTRPASHRGKSGWAPWLEGKRRRENGELVAIKQEMMETEAEERWAKPDAAMPVLRDVKKEELEEEKKITELVAIKQEMMETEAEERWTKPDATMPVLRDVKKEELE